MVDPFIIPDDSAMSIPKDADIDFWYLNTQTAYNRRVVEQTNKCGCFHCGSTFAGNNVVQWHHEDDGDDTALCPYCGEDAVIVGTDELPVSTALLVKLYQDWFKQDYWKRISTATDMPNFTSYDDYFRKGIPFRLKVDGNKKIVGAVQLFPITMIENGGYDSRDNNVFPDGMGGLATNYPGGIVKVKAYRDEQGHFISDFITQDGVKLPYAPWLDTEQDVLLDLTQTYGDRLKGIITVPGTDQAVRLFVD